MQGKQYFLLERGKKKLNLRKIHLILWCIKLNSTVMDWDSSEDLYSLIHCFFPYAPIS